MNIIQSLKMAFKNVFSNKMRALLTMLGIIIGIGSVIIITSIGAGSQQQISEQFDQLGVGRITVSLRNGRNATTSDMLTMDDYELLRENPNIKYITPTYSGSGATIKLLDPTETKNANLTGITADYKAINSPEILFGRFINDNDVDSYNKVCVINDSTALKVFGSADASVLGERISVRLRRGIQKYVVVGIIKNENASIETMYGDQYPENIILPISTLQKAFGAKTVSNLSIVVADVDNIDNISAEITTILDKKHKTTDKYYVQNLMQRMEQINSVTGMVTLFISCVAGISLVVGGIGVMNIMLVTVTERTREIGIRKSIGAKNRNILIQFLIEAVILTGTGGLLGLLLGWGGGKIAEKIMNITAIMSPQAVAVAILISTGIGIIFGVFPAYKAARLDPIEALRYE